MKPKCLLLPMLAILLAGCSSTPDTPAPTPSQTTPSASAPTPSVSAIPNGYPFGFDTYYVASRRDIPGDWGVPAAWYANAQADQFEVGDTPRPGAIAWSDKPATGRVAIVEAVSTDGTQVTISEMGGKGGWNRVTTSTVPAAWFKYIY